MQYDYIGMNKILQFLILFLLYILISPSSLAQSDRSYRLPKGITTADYDQQTIIVKLKDQKSGKNERTGSSIENILRQVKAEKAYQVFSQDNFEARNTSGNISAKHGLNRLYKIKINPEEDVITVINQLLKNKNIAYAEPYFKMRLLDVPNDPWANPATGNQYHLALIDAYRAWEIEKGDTNIVIGVLDTGTQLDHEDLQDNIKKNYNDPEDGIDNDGDGYIDNYHGWDFGNKDNDPTADGNSHGTMVSGVSAASTNNGIGIAGTGYHSKLMPVKVFTTENTTFINGFEAIVYAAEMGCQVINLSWGAPGAYSRYAEDLINYVVLEKDVVIVAAAGNTHAELDFYPASYANVLSVGNSTSEDVKNDGATYSTKINLMAPGTGIYTTTNNSNYTPAYGSSFSSPLVAGAAALLRSRYPEMTALQVMEKIRVTADDIYAIGNNADYFEKMGKGRLNIYKALTDLNARSIRMTNFTYEDKVGNYAFYDDTVNIKTTFTNFLNPVANAEIILSCKSQYVTIIDSVFQTGSLPTLGTIDNYGTPFKIYIHPDIPAGEMLKFRLGFEDGDYQDYQYFEIFTEQDFLTIDNGTVALSISSNGNMGYHNDSYYAGIGLTYRKQQLADFAGLIVATDSATLVNNVINNFKSLSRDKDFQAIKKIKYYHDAIADIEARSVFSEYITGLSIEQKILAWKAHPDKDYLIIEYRLTNSGSDTLHHINAGLFTDWDLFDFTKNKTGWDAANHLGYAYDSRYKELFAGVAVLNNGQPSFYALDKSTDINGDDFTREGKLQLLTAGTINSEAGNGFNSDIASATGGYIAVLPPKQSATIAFAITAGESLEDIQLKTQDALEKYKQYLVNRPLLASYTSCKGMPLNLFPEDDKTYQFYADANLDTLLFTGEGFLTDTLYSNRSYYLLSSGPDFESQVNKINVNVSTPDAHFLTDKDTLFIENEESITVQFTDQSQEAVKWYWDFDNGSTDTDKNPSAIFNEAGTYNVKLTIENEFGCLDSAEKVLVVAAVTGLKESSVKKEISLYPNPSRGILKIEYTGSDYPLELTVNDQLGRQVMQQQIKTDEVDLSLLPLGLYHIQLKSEREVITRKIILKN